MAIGVLGSANSTVAGNLVVYTVPAGISHAVVHINAMVNFTARVDALVDGRVIGVAYMNAGDIINFSTSIMLSPGSVVSLFTQAAPTGSQLASMLVTGYEVP